MSKFEDLQKSIEEDEENTVILALDDDTELDCGVGITFKVKYINEDWQEVAVDDYWYRYRYFAFRHYGDCEKLEEIELVEGVNILDSQAFYGCKNLVRVILPDTVTEIKDLAFGNCASLESIVLPKSLINVGKSIFYGCKKLTSISIDRANKRLYAVNNSIMDRKKNKLVYGFVDESTTSYSIPDGVSTIGKYALACNEQLLSIHIPNSVQVIEDFAFEGCVSLESINIPSSVTVVNKRILRDCRKVNVKCEVSEQPFAWSRFWSFTYNNVIWGCRNQNLRTNQYEEFFRNTLKGLSMAYKSGLLSKEETIDYEEFVNKYSFVVQMLS